MTPADGGFAVLGQDEPGPKGLAFKLSVGAGVVAALAILAGTAGLALTAGSGHKKPVQSHVSAQHLRRASGPMRVESIAPLAGTSNVSGSTTIMIAFSAPVAGSSAYPSLSPQVPGRWEPAGRTLTFWPDNPLPPSTRFTLRIPAGKSGVESEAGRLLVKAVTVRFSTGPYSELRLAELLSTLGYLPLSWTPGGYGRMSTDPVNVWPNSPQEMAFNPPIGTFIWQPGYPRELRSLWQPYRLNPLVRGAVMAFKAQHHLAVTPSMDRRFWREIFAAAERGQRNTAGYTYAVARKGSPETLTIWHNGRVVLRSLANTGIPIRPTVSGTFPVYSRFRHQVMRGTNSDGSQYADPAAFVAYFNGADAVRFTPRSSYGSEQSLGSVELPYQKAAQAWLYLTYGSLVTVTG